MSKIIDINQNKPHKFSMVICLKCYKRWVAVRPEETRLVELECAKCGQGFVIETGEEILEEE
jgi:predicted nucleic-acid-binding Zn-ribbon protein